MNVEQKILNVNISFKFKLIRVGVDHNDFLLTLTLLFYIFIKIFSCTFTLFSPIKFVCNPVDKLIRRFKSLWNYRYFLS